MASTPRFLIGFGERLTEPVPPPGGGGNAPPPYTPEEARERLRPQVQRAAHQARQLPAGACPANRVVSVLTLHPSFIAKSYFPGQARGEIVRVEEYRLPSVTERLRLPSDLPDEVALEVVLHAAGDSAYSYVLEAFEAFAGQLGVDLDLDRRLPVGGLSVESAHTPDLYDRVLRTYATRLEALVPRIGVPLQVQSEG